MSGSQHNPNGRQSQLGSGWSPLQVLQMANLLARAPQAHMASDRGVTWHTPTPPPHLYHVPAPSPPDPLQAMKSAGSNSVFRHTATPPELYRHTPTPPDKHLLRHTPSPGDVKAGAAIPPVDLYPHLGPGRGPTSLDKLVRADELLAYARVGVDLTLGSRANGATHQASPALSVRDAPTINSLIARAAPRRVDSLLERLVPSPASPHSVIVHSRVAPTPSPPSSNEDSADSNSAGGSKRKRKPERTVRVGARMSPASLERLENGVAPHNGPEKPPDPVLTPGAGPAGPGPAPAPAAVPLQEPAPVPAPTTAPALPFPIPTDAADCTRRKTRSGSAETIDDIAAMIAAGGAEIPAAPPAAPPLADKLEAVLASPEPAPASPEPAPASPEPAPASPEPAPASPPPPHYAPQVETAPVTLAPVSVPAATAPVTTVPASTMDEVDAEKDRLNDTTQSSSTGEGPRGVSAAVVPRRRSTRTSHCEATNVPVESPSEAKPALESSAPPAAAASFVEVENQLEKMFAALDDGSTAAAASTAAPPPPKRRKSAPARPRKGPRKKESKPHRKEKESVKDAYDSGSNASSGRSRGPYIQIRGPRESPVSVCVMNASGGVGGGEEEDTGRRRGAGEERRRGLHASTLGLRYDAATRDHTWVCAFCLRPPHADHLGDLFGPYPVDTDHEEYRALDEATRRLHAANGGEVWLHAECAVWAPGVVARGARVWGLARAVWAAAAARCRHCARPAAAVACAARACVQRAHLPCARAHAWSLSEEDFRAFCPLHPPPEQT